MTQKAVEAIGVGDFLQDKPPGSEYQLTDVQVSGDNVLWQTPEIHLHCPLCRGARRFKRADAPSSIYGTSIMRYKCKDCGNLEKTYAVKCSPKNDRWYALKIGEWPPFGPPIPARVVTLLGGDRDEFLQGYRCEKQSFGVAAFTYYRRVVEGQKGRIFDEIVRVSKALNESKDLIAELEAAKHEKQFTKAVESIKHALPQALMVNGYNPLTLLHDALSEGVHALSDTQCLEMAADIRVVLFEFAERLARAMNDDKDLQEAVTRLANRQRPKPGNPVEA